MVSNLALLLVVFCLFVFPIDGAASTAVKGLIVRVLSRQFSRIIDTKRLKSFLESESRV